jgi:toluene monooxygenase system ferredoxin subunit
MPFIRVCSVADVPADDMTAFYVDGWEVLLLRDQSGTLNAFEGICPHEGLPLVDGIFDGGTVTCIGHFWVFDAATGRGLSPPSCRIAKYEVKVEGDDVLVDLGSSSA